ncbi:MAG: leucine-rich repeat protein [Bacteroidales bacterium]|nr:leucine-rich repeat protein [Bacteroidales bacterium]MCM1416450.1 leucine-rich repeat protein [bacterium]MCM1424425.1 leucine-rich repeat protein [bacterium]
MKRRKLTCVACIVIMFAMILNGCGSGTDTTAADNKSTSAEEDTVTPENIAPMAEEDTMEVSASEGPTSQEEKEPEKQGNEEVSEKDGTETSVSVVDSDLKVSEGLEFESNDDGTCTIKGIGVCTDTDLVIPTESPKGEKVTWIDERAFYNLEDVESITLLNGTYEIDDYAFQYGEFTALSIIGGSPIINKSAFSSCEDLKSILISDCNLQADEYAFFSCGKDADVKFINCSGTIGEYAFQYSDMLTLEMNNCELEIQKSAFSTCENLTSITIADTSIEADEYAFFGCGDSAKVEMTNCQVVLDDYAFQYSSLESLTISGSKLETGKSAFSSCEDLVTITINCDQITLDEYTFFGCEDLVNVSLCENTESAEVSIDDYAFQYCERLETAAIGGSVVKLGKYVFSGCADSLIITHDGNSYTAQSVEDGISS